MKKVFNVAIVGSEEQEFLFLKKSLESAPFDVAFTIAKQDESFLHRISDETDITVFCQKEDAPDPEHLPVFLNKTLLVTSSGNTENPLAAFEKGAAQVLNRPLFRAEFLVAVQNLLRRSTKYQQSRLADTAILAFLEGISRSGKTVIEPFFAPLKAIGHFYPDATRIIGELEDEEGYLEALAERGFFTKTLKNRVRLCTLCNCCQVNYREVCPVCSAIDIVKGQMIHHFHCGHIDSLESYRQGADLVCPKCEQTLRHIGIDYEKPSDYFKCTGCKSIFPDPDVQCQCLVCGLVAPPDKTIEKNVYAYELSEFARESLRRGEIKGVDLSAILYNNHTNLYNKQYFEMELNRELIRMKRYSTDFTLVLARIEKIDEIRRTHPDRVTWYLNNLFAALNKDLRELDITCVWESHILGILLSQTDMEGAKVVVERIHNNIRSLEYLYDVCRPEVTFSVITGEGFHDSGEQMTELAMKELNNG